MIKQTHFSPAIKFFEKRFLEFNNLQPYYDEKAPCYFAGCYTMDDVRKINNHKGLKIVWATNQQRIAMLNCLDTENLIINNSTEKLDYSLLLPEYKIKDANIQMKDNSIFQPNKLGENIYCYLGRPEAGEFYGYNEVMQLKQKTRFNIIVGYQGHSLEKIKQDFYDKSFVHFKPAKWSGGSTARELLLMGREVITTTNDPIYKQYENIDHAIELIEREAEKIGTTQKSLLPLNYFVPREIWQKIDFWFN